MNKPQLSIIVPVYNVEQYLSACVDSILSQDYREYELILIDDGSTDRSPAMCDEYALKDSRVRVFHQQNAGQACVRNVGLAVTSGKYITFVDSDDLLADGALLSLMIEIERSGADIVLGNVTRFDEMGNKRPYSRLKERRELTGKEALCLLLEGRQMNISVCGGIYKQNILDGIQFPVGYVCEDWHVTPSIYLKAHKVIYLPDPWYLYRVNSQGTMATLYIKTNPQIIDVCRHCIEVIHGSGDAQLYKDTLWSNLKRVWKYVGIIYFRHRTKEEKFFLKEVHTLMAGYEKDLHKTHTMNFQEKLGVWSFCHCKPLCTFLYKLKNLF